MPASFVPRTVEILRFLPELLLTVAGTIIMVLAPIRRLRSVGAFAYLAFAGLVSATIAAVAAQSHPGFSFSGMLVVDAFGTFFRVLVIVAGLLIVLCSVSYWRREGSDPAEYYALLLFSVTGQCLMATADELIMIFIGLEISSIGSYILAGYLRNDRRSSEAALKYFLLGSFATAFLLYGIAWLYGLTGTTSLVEIEPAAASLLRAPAAILVMTAAALMFVGLAFKVSAWPFQVWAPDVYQGAPAPVAAFLSTGPKAAAFAVFLRVYLTAFGPYSQRWVPLVWISALVTMLVGNFAALRQSNIKRLLGYSSIAHAGYVLVAVAAGSDGGAAAVMFYLAAYTFMNVGAFAVVSHFARRGERYVEIQDFRGLAERQPGTAALMTVFLLSLIGVPMTGGFFGKFYIFKAAVDAHLIWLTVLGLLSSAVGAYYYLRILVAMYMQEPAEPVNTLPSVPASLKVVLWTCAVATILLGVFPSFVLRLATGPHVFTGQVLP